MVAMAAMFEIFFILLKIMLCVCIIWIICNYEKKFEIYKKKYSPRMFACLLSKTKKKPTTTLTTVILLLAHYYNVCVCVTMVIVYYYRNEKK